MKKPRLHQMEGAERAKAIVDGYCSDSTTVASVTPGGGKTGLAAIFSGVLLRGGFVDQVVWVCPRSTLAEQSAGGFWDDDFNSSPGHGARWATDNKKPLIRGKNVVCSTTTYQAVVARPGAWRDTVSERNTLVILDEPHHLADRDQSGWHTKLIPVVDAAKHVLLMTGTIERHDRLPIPFLEYAADGGGRVVPRAHIVYSRRDALRERAVIPMNFVYAKGSVTYTDEDGTHTHQISDATENNCSRVIATFLDSRDFRQSMIDEGMHHLQQFRRNAYRSRAIIVCKDQNHARHADYYVRKRWGLKAYLAISDEPQAHKRIREFKGDKKKRIPPRGDVLVTVGMAYEGLDVPDCTHLICLSNTRSVPYLEQMFNRVTRVDYDCGLPWDGQWAHVFVPDDIRMRNVVEAMKLEQANGLKDAQTCGGGREGPAPGLFFSPQGAELDGLAYGTIADRLDDETCLLVERVRDAIPSVAHVPASDLAQIINAGRAPSAPPSRPYDCAEERTLRESLDKKTKAHDRAMGWDFGETNRELFARFGPRSEMCLDQIKAALRWLDERVAGAA